MYKKEKANRGFSQLKDGYASYKSTSPSKKNVGIAIVGAISACIAMFLLINRIHDRIDRDIKSSDRIVTTEKHPIFKPYIWPTKGTWTSGFGPRWGRMHKGIDIAGPVGTPIFSVAPGVVVKAGWNNGGYGNVVEILHPDGNMTRYAHNSRIIVREGDTVEQGQHIADMGSTGSTTASHLHFEIHPSGKEAVDPIAFLPKEYSSYQIQLDLPKSYQ